MWRQYLKSAFRRMAVDRFFSFVNLLGLTVGLASVVAISLFVRNEFGHDAWLAGHERLFRVDTLETIPGREPIEIALAPGPLRDALQRDFPQIEAVTRGYGASINVRRDGQLFGEEVLVADPDFFGLIELPFIVGDGRRALSEPSSVVLSERAAERYFGRRDAVGERLTLMLPDPREFVVSAVFETIPRNSHMDFDVVIPHAAWFRPSSDGSATIPESWAGAYFHTYVRLRDPAGRDAVAAGLPAFTDRHVPQWITDQLAVPAHEFYDFRLVPLRDIHFDGAPIGAMKPGGNRATVAALSGVAVLILLIAGINFANLGAARSALRTREVAIRKVLGARRRQILAQFMVEAGLLTAIAGLVALALVELALPWLGARLGGAEGLPPPSEWEMWAGLLFLILLTALASALYPSLVVSGIAPAQAFRRDKVASGGGRWRDLLVGTQFTISIALIVVTLGMALQNRFARDMDLGFDRDDLLIVRVPDGPAQDVLARSFRDAVARHPEVIGAALSSSVPSDRSEDNISVRRPDAVRPVQLGFHRVDSHFFESYRVEPLAGRTVTTRQSQAAVINRSALQRLGYREAGEALGDVLQTGREAYVIAGVVPDLHFRPLHEPVRDELYILDDAAGGIVSIRYRTDDLPAFLAAIDRSWNGLAPDRPIERAFLDDLLDELYARERAQADIVGLFSLVAIALSCLGLVGMVAFVIQRRTREIALRKVLGARSRDILRLLLWQFSRPVLFANLIAWPLAWLVLSRWLNGFAYRIDMPLWAFAFAGAAALVVALLAVGLHTVRVARENPIRALRDL